MTLLTICQNAAVEVGYPEPSTIINNTDATANQLLKLVNRLGNQIVRAYQWQALVTETSFTTQAQEEQASLPADFHRFINDTMYNRDENRKVYGPNSSQVWQLDNSFITARAYDTYRIRNNKILFEPDPEAGQSVYYEYVSNYWVDTDADGVGEASEFAADSNASLIDEEVLTLGLVYRFLRAKGFAWQDAFQEYRVELQNAMAQDGSKPALRISHPREFTLGKGNVPDTGFGNS